ncbi:Bug family tripartite tricarboxylate transporter substrate binding protein [Chelatococcus asaccharovorans]|uniref:Bug family tripartite tricarboxylate transporter substrate binding protein n=1 Tax=Chelatococcus asaccharovorans TaxID=28210 RepID=UPI00224C798D|nr:tripartite tricarboxylate transporter substrate binding protein [Chelatococcus asaccharovorans]CAH1650728.1 Tripartite-type tricarboxylate transporter receptor subunit TctC [Chelatococcus asaccharovorans]CAH1692495.1 Tripartite-type tricarboxylate transporter receptor subunit TctC [Chelatococcus asaccharovorans]
MFMRLVGLSLAIGMGSAAQVQEAAQAQEAYPNRAIHVIVPLPAGSAADGVARIVMPAAEKLLGQPIIIENEGGAASIPGTARAAKAKPDGYTFLFGTVATQASNPNIFNKLPYDPSKDFTAVARVAGQSLVMAVPKVSGVKTIDEFVAKAKKSGNMSYASAGIGTSAHLSAELLKLRTGIPLRHIPYQGGSQSVLDLMRGETDAMFYSLAQFQPGLQSGELILLGNAGETRTKFKSDLPTLRELGYDVVINSWYGLYAPTGTPAEAIEKMAAAVNKALTEPAVIEALEKTGTEVYASASPAEFQKFTDAERKRYGELIAAAGIPKK